MKELFLAVVLLCCLHRVVAQVDNDLATEGLKGRVKVVTEIEYTDEAMRRPFMKTVDKYDSKGNLTETIHNDYVLKMNTRKTVKYDTDKNGAVAQRNEYDEKGAQVRMVKYKYNRSHITEEEDHRYYDGKDMVYKNEYIYDSTGNRLLQKKTYTNGAQDDSTVYIYDNAGRMAGAKVYDRSGKQAGLSDYYYYTGDQWVHCEKQAEGVRTHLFRIVDTAGLLIEKTTYVSDYTKQTNETNLSFDKQGNWLTQSVKGTITENFFIARTIEYYK